jgi:Kelch motif
MSARFVARILAFLILAMSPIEQRAALAQPVGANPHVEVTGSLHDSREGHTATLLPNGQVLVAGGANRLRTNNTAELYDPDTGIWRLTGSLSRRVYHSATLLPNGQVLVVGGWDLDIESERYVNTAELYDPVTELWRPTQSPITPRGYNTALLLPDGRVLAVSFFDGPVAELFDPSTESWRLTNPPSRGWLLALLPSGLVLAADGSSSELYDPATEMWSGTSNLNAIVHVLTLTVLRNGLVLATGCRDDRRETFAELYDPATGSWQRTGSLAQNRSFGQHTATLMPNGHVLVAGGADQKGIHRSMELYDPAAGVWNPMPSLVDRRDFHTATLLANDKVLFAAGFDPYEFPVFHTSTELFDLGLPRPTFLTVDKGTIAQGQCYTITVGNGSGMAVDVQYRYEGGSPQTLIRWPRLDQKGRAENICASQQTPVGTYEFSAIRNSETGQWQPVSSWVTVTRP